MSFKKILHFFLVLTVGLSVLSGCEAKLEEDEMKTDDNPPVTDEVKYEGLATFAGGCFWCMEPAFEALDGVGDVISGYAGGTEEEATYKKVSSGKTSHRESVQVAYDPVSVSYESLLETFFHQIDPTDDGGQFVDRGPQYRTAIFYHDEEQKKLAEKAVVALTASKKFEKPIMTAIVPYTTFFPAEEYHQDFYKKSSDYYKRYKDGSGRTDFISDNWAKEEALKYSRENEEACASYKCFKKPTAEELMKSLTKIQYNVTQKEGTERPFDNQYWDNEGEGIYVDIVSGEPLFSSTDKFDSGTGWPSFTKPLSPDLVTLKTDGQLFYERTEARSKLADSHLGHVFDDGPKDRGGKRWCMNSAALKFIPKEELTGEYEEFRAMFGN